MLLLTFDLHVGEKAQIIIYNRLVMGHCQRLYMAPYIVFVIVTVQIQSVFWGCQSIPEVPQGTLSVLNIATVSFYGTTPTNITSIQGQKTIYW